MKLFITFFIAYFILFVQCSNSKKSYKIHAKINDRSSIWWRFNSFYNEAYLSVLKKEYEIDKKRKEQEQKKQNEMLIEKLLNQAKNTILNGLTRKEANH